MLAGWQSDWKARQCEKHSSCESCAQAPLNCVWQEKRQAALRWRDCGYHLFYTASQEACAAKCVHADAEHVGHITSTLVTSLRRWCGLPSPLIPSHFPRQAGCSSTRTGPRNAITHTSAQGLSHTYYSLLVEPAAILSTGFSLDALTANWFRLAIGSRAIRHPSITLAPASADGYIGVARSRVQLALSSTAQSCSSICCTLVGVAGFAALLLLLAVAKQEGGAGEEREGRRARARGSLGGMSLRRASHRHRHPRWQLRPAVRARRCSKLPAAARRLGQNCHRVRYTSTCAVPVRVSPVRGNVWYSFSST